MSVNAAYNYKQEIRLSPDCSQSFRKSSISISSSIEGTFIWSLKMALRDWCKNNLFAENPFAYFLSVLSCIGVYSNVW